MPTATLSEIVKEATSIGLNIIASVRDQGSTNGAAIDMLLQETKRHVILGNEEEVEENARNYLSL